MEGRRLIKVTDTSALAAVGWQGKPVLERHAELVAFLAANAVGELSHLFAEPITGGAGRTGYRAVSWYTALQGDVVPLAHLPDGERGPVVAELRDALERLRGLVTDPEAGGLLHRALLFASEADVYVVFGHPVLLNWGLAPTAVLEDEVSLARHWAATTARFTILPPPNLADQPSVASIAAPAALAATTVAGATAAPQVSAVAPPPPPLAGDVRWYQRPGIWAACSVGLLVIGLLIGLLVWRHLPADPALAGDVERQRAVNAALEEEIRRARATLGMDVCAIDPKAIAPLALQAPARPQGEMVAVPPGVTPATPVTPSTPAIPAAPPGPAPQGQAAPAEPTPQGQAAPQASPGEPASQPPAAVNPPAPSSIADLAETGTALVITERGTGSGFFITPTQLITNRHVVEKAKSTVLVSSKALGGVRPAKVRFMSPKGDRDYALIDVDTGPQSKVVPMKVSSAGAKLDRVVAAGYPGLISSDDPKFRRLLNGDVSAVPELVFSEGVVSTKFDASPPIIVHTAVISQGNSGGPLIDACGRVIGINTLIKTSGQTSHQGNYALASSDLRSFLANQGVEVADSAAACQPARGQQ